MSQNNLVKDYFDYYNHEREHSSIDDQTPYEFYSKHLKVAAWSGLTQSNTTRKISKESFAMLNCAKPTILSNLISY